MENLPKIRSRQDMQSLTTSSSSLNGEKLDRASRLMKRILGAFPDYGKASPEYLLSITEYLAYLPADEQEALAHPVSGIASKTEFLPTKAKMAEFLADRFKRLNTRATGYRYFKPGEGDPLEISDLERRKAIVFKELGYDPLKPKPRDLKPLEPAIRDAIAEDRYSLSHLKTPSRPASPELKALLIEQGYLMPPKREEEAA